MAVPMAAVVLVEPVVLVVAQGLVALWVLQEAAEVRTVPTEAAHLLLVVVLDKVLLLVNLVRQPILYMLAVEVERLVIPFKVLEVPVAAEEEPHIMVLPLFQRVVKLVVRILVVVVAVLPCRQLENLVRAVLESLSSVKPGPRQR